MTMNKEMRSLIKFALYIFAFISLGLIFGYLTFKVLSFSRTVDVPDLYGKSPLEANRLLTNKRLYLKIEGEDYDSAVSSGNIIRQDIPAGNKVKERRGIKVVISRGPRVKSVPVLLDETLVNAESLLLQKGLKISKVIMVHSDTIEKDRVVAQKPGTEEQVSDTVTVLVSLGPYDQMYVCPDFRGMSGEAATAIVKKLNLKLITEGSRETVETQKPEAGRQIKTGDTIYLKLI